MGGLVTRQAHDNVAEAATTHLPTSPQLSRTSADPMVIACGAAARAELCACVVARPNIRVLSTLAMCDASESRWAARVPE